MSDLQFGTRKFHQPFLVGLSRCEETVLVTTKLLHLVLLINKCVAYDILILPNDSILPRAPGGGSQRKGNKNLVVDL